MARLSITGESSKIMLEDFIVGLFVLATYIFENNQFSVLFSIIQAIFFIYFTGILVINKRIPACFIVFWACLVSFIAIILLFFNNNTSVVTSTLIVIKNCIKALFVTLYLYRRKCANILIFFIAASGILCGLEILNSFLNNSMQYTQLQYAYNSRIGAEIAGGNVNIVALNMCFAFSALLYLAKIQKNILIKRLIYLGALFVVVTSIFTGTRKILFFYVSALIISSNETELKYKILTLLGLLGVYFALINIEPLYFFIGHKIDFFSENNAFNMYYASDDTRLDLALGALNLFFEHPLGIGFGNVGNYLGVYAHNNYVEVLASLGIIGFLIFYAIYFYGLYNSIKYRYNQLCRYCFYTLVGLMVIEMGQVTCLYPIVYIFFPIFIIAFSKKRLNNA